jgi:hypothetical protein
MLRVAINDDAKRRIAEMYAEKPPATVDIASRVL